MKHRDLYLIGGIAVIAVVIGGALFLAGPSSLQSDFNTVLTPGSTNTPVSVPFTVLEQGQSAVSVTQRTNYRISTPADLASLWILVYGNGGPQIPPIDFTKNEVLAVFDGSHATDGYRITIQSVQDSNATRMVMISHAVPGSTCTTNNVTTSPFEIVEVPKTAFSLAHQDMLSTTTCP